MAMKLLSSMRATENGNEIAAPLPAVQRAVAAVARQIEDQVAGPILERPVQLEVIVEAAKLVGLLRLG